jgi:hypothetical protein
MTLGRLGRGLDGGDLIADLRSQRVQAPCPREGIACLPLHRSQEEVEPSCPVAGGRHAEYPFVVLVTSRLDVGREVKQRRGEQTPLDQEEHHQQPPHAAVPIDEVVDGFELVVNRGNGQQRWQTAVGVQEPLEPIKTLPESFGRRRDTHRIVGHRTWWADPVLAGSELTGCGVSAPDTSQQNVMSLPRRTQAEGEPTLRGQYVVDGSQVVEDLPDVVVLVVLWLVDLEQDKVGQGRLGAFDPA